MESISTDVVVAGSGMAGLSAAVRAQETGANVVVLEKGHQAGGTTYISGGAISVNDDESPSIDAHEPVEEGLAWLEDHGVKTRVPAETWDPIQEDQPIKKRFDPPQFTNRMVEILESNGGQIRLKTPLTELRADEAGRIIGAEGYDHEADTAVSIEAQAVILATGSFPGNQELIQRYVDGLPSLGLGANPWSTGDGFEAAKRLGALGSGAFSRPHGHSVLAPPARFTYEEVREASMYFETKSIALDMNGRRFTDESVTNLGNHGYVRGLVHEANGEAFLVIDGDLYEENWPHISVESKIDNARRFGAPLVEAESLEELAERLQEWDIDGENALDSIQTFNHAVAAGQGATLDPPRSRLQVPMDTPPFIAVGVVAGIDYYYGGLDINANGQILRQASSSGSVPYATESSDEYRFSPIPGLYAAGTEVGRPGPEGYHNGGLSLGLVTGRIAGQHAAEFSTAR